MKDKAGREIEQGDRVAYAVRVGNAAEMKLGTVHSVGAHYILVKGDNQTRMSELYNWRNILVVSRELV